MIFLPCYQSSGVSSDLTSPRPRVASIGSDRGLIFWTIGKQSPCCYIFNTGILNVVASWITPSESSPSTMSSERDEVFNNVWFSAYTSITAFAVNKSPPVSQSINEEFSRKIGLR